MYHFSNFRNPLVCFSILGLFLLSSFFVYSYALDRFRTIGENTTGNSESLSVLNKKKNDEPSSGFSSLTKANKSSEPKPPPVPSSGKTLNGGQQRTATVVEGSLEDRTSAYENVSISEIYQTGLAAAIPDKCPDSGAYLDLLVLIISAPDNTKARMAIRSTWAHFDRRKDVSIAFLLGDTTDQKIEEALSKEEDLYADIIRGNFIDAYSNLTLKAVSILEWVSNYCRNAKFVLKTDDDMFINVPALLSFIEMHAREKNVIYGRLAKQWLPSRDKKSKYYLSPKEFEPKVFPDFTTGPAYLMSNDVVPKLYAGCLQQTFMKLEDVFVTGVVAEKLGIKRIHAGGFSNVRVSFNPCMVGRSISIHMVKYHEQFELWRMLLDGRSNCKLPYKLDDGLGVP